MFYDIMLIYYSLFISFMSLSGILLWAGCFCTNSTVCVLFISCPTQFVWFEKKRKEKSEVHHNHAFDYTNNVLYLIKIQIHTEIIPIKMENTLRNIILSQVSFTQPSSFHCGLRWVICSERD